MKIIEAMKSLKDLQRKLDDLQEKVKTHCADSDYESAPYGAEQAEVVKGWIQGYSDILKLIMALKIRIQKTNLATEVTITIADKPVTKTIAEWVLRRGQGRERPGLAHAELRIWRSLTDRGLKEGTLPSSVPGAPAREVKIRRYYDPKLRDDKINEFASEPSLIDAALEVANATTELLD